MNERILFAKEDYSRLLTPELLNKFSFVMQLAAEAKAYPSQSGFFVRTAGMTKNGMYYKGGNKEFAHSDAYIHGETAVASGLSDLTDSPIEIIGWHKDGEITPADFGRPCGNCRDILLEYCSPETFLLNGNEKAYVVAQLKDYLFKDFRRVEPVIDEGLLAEGLKAARGGNDVYLPERLKKDMYGAVLVAENGMIWKGKHYSNVGYDAVPAAMGAALNWIYNYPEEVIDPGRLRLAKLIIVGENRNPEVFYRDRQAILELDEILRKFTKNTNPLKVEIYNAAHRGHKDIVLEAYKADVNQWLPKPFSPEAFRMDDVMFGQLGKFIGQENLLKLKI